MLTEEPKKMENYVKLCNNGMLEFDERNETIENIKLIREAYELEMSLNSMYLQALTDKESQDLERKELQFNSLVTASALLSGFVLTCLVEVELESKSLVNCICVSAGAENTKIEHINSTTKDNINAITNGICNPNSDLLNVGDIILLVYSTSGILLFLGLLLTTFKGVFGLMQRATTYTTESSDYLNESLTMLKLSLSLCGPLHMISLIWVKLCPATLSLWPPVAVTILLLIFGGIFLYEVLRNIKSLEMSKKENFEIKEKINKEWNDKKEVKWGFDRVEKGKELLRMLHEGYELFNEYAKLRKQKKQ